jgi:hypothetical protein
LKIRKTNILVETQGIDVIKKRIEIKPKSQKTFKYGRRHEKQKQKNNKKRKYEKKSRTGAAWHRTHEPDSHTHDKPNLNQNVNLNPKPHTRKKKKKTSRPGAQVPHGTTVDRPTRDQQLKDKKKGKRKKMETGRQCTPWYHRRYQWPHT